MIFTLSEIAKFLSCRQAWDLTSHNRQALRRVGLGTPALNIGSIVHAGLEAHTNGQHNPVELARMVALEVVTEKRATYKEITGADWDSSEWDMASEQEQFACGLVAHYCAYYGQQPFPGYEVIKTEQPWRVPIPGTPHELAGTWDVVLRDPNGHTVICDHKTYKSKPQDRMEFSWQFRGYMWAAAQFGWPVSGFLYNGLRKAVPVSPEPLKRGGFSKNIKQNTTESLYRMAIAVAGLNPEPYEAFLEKIRGREATYFHREFVGRNMLREQKFVGDLRRVAHEMSNARWCYPNHSWTCNKFCDVKGLCDKIENKVLVGDPPAGYEKNATYGTTAALEVTPTEVGSLEELRDARRDRG